MFKLLKKWPKLIFFIVLLIFLIGLIYQSYLEKLTNNEDLSVSLCENGCDYLFPKELHPEKIDTGNGKNPTVIIRMKIDEISIPIYINKTSKAFNYNENLDKNKKTEKLILYESESFDSIYKTPYLYFFDKKNLRSIVRQGSLTFTVFKKINDNIYLSYIIPKEITKGVIKIDDEITTRINSFQRIKQ
jgi:hypothetical protein